MVLASGIIKIVLGLSFIVLLRYREIVGWSAAIFFMRIFSGNVAQYINSIDAFGLDTDIARFIRLLFQSVLCAWALWSTIGGLHKMMVC